MTFEEINSVKNLRAEFERERQKLESLRLLAESCYVSSFDGLPRAQSLTSKTEKFAVRISEAEERIKILAAEIEREAADLAAIIWSVISDNLLADVMTRHFCAGLSLGDIGKQLSYTRDYIWKLRKRGVKILLAAPTVSTTSTG